MYKTFAVLASAVSCSTSNDLSALHRSLEGMLDGVEATFHTDAAYRVAKKASVVDLAYTSANATGGYYNKFTGYYAQPCASPSQYDTYGYASATRSYFA